jgi:ribosomal protein L4
MIWNASPIYRGRDSNKSYIYGVIIAQRQNQFKETGDTKLAGRITSD